MATTRVKKTSIRTSEQVEQEEQTTDAEQAQEGQKAARRSEEAEPGHDVDDDARAYAEAARADALHAGDEGLGPVSEPERSCDIEHMDAKTLGRKGESAAVRYLEHRGYTLVERNWTCRYGEADIIAYDEDGTLCFIEVKTRRSVEAGIPEESVTAEKQRKYEKIALCYLLEEDVGDGVPVRFDAIGICVNKNARALLRHHKGCFDGIA